MSTKREPLALPYLAKRLGKLTLGKFLSAWRRSDELSQKEFAKKLGLSSANLCDIEKGRKGVSIYKAAEIAKIIGYSPTILVELALQEQVNELGMAYVVSVRERK